MTSSNPVSNWVPPDPLGPDKRVPLMRGRRLEMFKALEDHDSYYELSLMFSALAGDLQQLGANLPGSSSAALKIRQDKTNKRAMCILLHSILKDLLRSVILGTVAFDMISPTRKPAHYAADGPGAYVAAMAIDGRDGKWLNRDEIRDLIKTLNMYVKAYEAWKIHKGKPDNAEARDLDKFAREIDTQYGSRYAEQPDEMRFVNHDDATAKTQFFMNSLIQRCDPSLPGPDQIYQIASPLYVGCSESMNVSITKYQPSTGLRLVNKPWGLVCCALKYMGKHPTVVVTPVIRTWQRTDLPLAEILVTMLGSSLVTQDGFNGHGPGTTNDTSTQSVLSEAERYVLALEPHLKNNIEASLREMAERKTYFERMEVVARFPDTDAESALGDLRKLEHEIYAIDDQCAALVRKLEADRAEMEAQTKAAERYVKLLREVNQVFRIFFGPEQVKEEPTPTDEEE
ncbi:uncharacterized protein F4812DRAFT_361139 [Daldinia caldariorum]|uniref:uncharacterized protein n=1 Tax=Daldinia caldariorum TaxID=326644 RepID=UPI0020074885|nr:uncharacterized protein F4812DRAFT_361139 [Daldinia caldariorum]KAI1468286.1 hypothetical protein F4812DRAFT_361139 [Daldinia caldariorum]